MSAYTPHRCACNTVAAPRSRCALLASLLALSALLAGCWQQPIETRLPTPNPNPTERYLVTVEVTNAPGEFNSAEGFVLFQMNDETRQCVPNQPNGAKAAATSGLEMPFTLTKTAVNTFEGVAVLDQFVPNDDYGLGLCDWTPFLVKAQLNNGVNLHNGFVDVATSKQSSRPDEKFRVADGHYRGRRAFRLSIWDNDRALPSDPAPKANDPLPFFSGGYSDAKQMIVPADFNNYYFITVTAQRMDPSP
jgi:hypothetical protein